MKRFLNIQLMVLIAAGISFISCEINDPVDNITRVGKTAPHVFWELPSSSVNAGNPVPFYAQYYTTSEVDIDRIEVWYDINEVVQRSVSCPLVTTFKYSISSSTDSLSREFQKISVYEHKKSNWLDLKKAFILDTVFPTSKTLRLVEWKEVKTFDTNTFDVYFPKTFPKQFKDSMYKMLKVADFRKIMLTLNLMTSAEFIACTDSTFNQNSGAYDYFLKADKIPLLQSKYEGIAFKDLIYDASTQIYKVEYSKQFKLNARIKVFDKEGITGIADKKEIELR
jgi:hypothetical protein